MGPLRCGRCGGIGECRAGCPRSQPQFAEWAKGLNEGRTGQPLRKDNVPAYRLGWIRGRLEWLGKVNRP